VRTRHVRPEANVYSSVMVGLGYGGTDSSANRSNHLEAHDREQVDDTRSADCLNESDPFDFSLLDPLVTAVVEFGCP